MDDTATRATAPTASLLRAWCYLVWLSWQRQMRARQMVWIALGLLGFATLFVSINTWLGVWDMRNWRLPNRAAPTVRQWDDAGPTGWGELGPDGKVRPNDPMDMKAVLAVLWGAPRPPGAFPVDLAVLTVLPTILSPFSLQVQVFVVRGVVFGFFLNILLPLWSLSFATEAMG